MLTFARIALPAVGLMLAVGCFVTISAFDPEPESRSTVGSVIVVTLIVLSQAGLAAAPFAMHWSREARVYLTLAMFPSTVLLAFVIVDLLPRVIDERSIRATAAVSVLGLCTYLFGIALLLKERRNDSEERSSTAV